MLLPIITLKFFIEAPSALCFDLARSIDLHMVSTEQTGEKAIAGVTTSLIGLGESVTWRAKHFGIWQTLTSKITEFDYPHGFVDEMAEGAFKHFHHQHLFKETEGSTLMTDTFEYSVPYGILGKLFDRLVLNRYMTHLLSQRNMVIRQYAESGGWRKILRLPNGKLPDTHLRFYSFQIMKRLFEELWFASGNGLLPIQFMSICMMEVSRSLETKKSIVTPYFRFLLKNQIITETSQESQFFEFTEKGILVKSDQDIHNFMGENLLTLIKNS